MEIQSIFAWKSLPEAGFGKNVVIDAHRCSGSRIHLDHRSAGRSVIQDHSSDHRFKRLHLTRASVRRASGFVLTSKPEVIPETESLPYLQKSQRRSRRRILSTRSLSFLCWCVQSVRNRHAQDYSELHQSRGSVNCESQKLLERLGVARVWHHTQNPPTFGSWGFNSPSRHQPKSPCGTRASSTLAAPQMSWPNHPRKCLVTPL